MTTSPQPCAVVSLRDIELEGQVNCARRRLVVIAPGLSESVAKAIVKKWSELGRDAVQLVLDPDPEVCRLDLGDLVALQILSDAAERIGGRIQKQPGLRVGVIVTDETTTVFSPTPRLIEAGDRWLETAVGPRVRPKTFHDYEGMLHRYVRPILGERILAALRPLDLQAMYQHMTERGRPRALSVTRMC